VQIVAIEPTQESITSLQKINNFYRNCQSNNNRRKLEIENQNFLNKKPIRFKNGGCNFQVFKTHRKNSENTNETDPKRKKRN
jgi:hypothetical protein